MPTPRHLRHPAPHPPHRHTTRIPSPLLPSIRYPLTTLYRLAILDLYIRTSPRPTSSPSYSTSIYAPRTRLLPHILIPSSVALSYPSAQRPTPLPHALTPSSASRSYLSTLLPTPLPHALTPSSAPRSYLSILLPTPLPCTLRSPFCGKVCTPPPKASSNPPVEIFCSKGRRRLILNILPRRHRVDNSVSSSVHSEEKA